MLITTASSSFWLSMGKNNKGCFSGNFCNDALRGKVIPLKDKCRNNSPDIGQDVGITARHDMPMTPDNSSPHWHTPQSTASSILHIIFLPLLDDYWELFKIKAPWEEIWSRGQYVSAQDGGIDFIWEYFRGVVCNLGPYPVHLVAQYVGKHFHIRYHLDVAFASFRIL